jgi:nucleotide-binding universal stress UspA family protein
MKTILLPFHDDEIDLAALQTALLLAGRFGSYVEGLFVWQPPQIIAGAGEGITLYGDYVTQVAAEGRQLATQARERFSQLIRERDIPFQNVSVALNAPSAGWYEGEGLEDRVVGDYGRVFDLIVIGRTNRPTSGDWQTTCEAALFESGRPIVLAPPQTPVKLGETVLIAWNGSTETARTIALGMPLLLQAHKVIVLTVEDGTVPGPSGEQMTSHLLRHGINARALTVPQDKSVGEAILRQCAELEVDLLFKGAYTQSRLRQMIFGGATRHILAHAQLPVLMAH